VSDHFEDTSGRECHACGARLTSWYCEVCGDDSLDAIERAYVAELATPWRSLSPVRRRVVVESPLAA